MWKVLRIWFFRAKMALMNDYSQSGETRVIRGLLPKKRSGAGFFVEIGANDGVTVSSTYGLVKRGWSGISVEANPVVFERLQQNLQNYPRIQTVCLAVAPQRGMVRLYLGKNDPQGLLSTISTDNSPWFEENRAESYLEVMGVPPTELFGDLEVPAAFDLLLIDAEGMDYDILLSLDFKRYRPTLIVTEDYQPKNDLKFKLLEQMCYLQVRQVGCNSFWMDQQEA